MHLQKCHGHLVLAATTHHAERQIAGAGNTNYALPACMKGIAECWPWGLSIVIGMVLPEGPRQNRTPARSRTHVRTHGFEEDSRAQITRVCQRNRQHVALLITRN